MKKCECGEKMKELSGKTPDGIEYNYLRCDKCNEEIVDMKQLHTVAEKYRTLKKYQVKLSKWGLSLGVRIPKELVEKYKLRNDGEVTIIPEKDGMKIVS